MTSEELSSYFFSVITLIILLIKFYQQQNNTFKLTNRIDKFNNEQKDRSEMITSKIDQFKKMKRKITIIGDNLKEFMGQMMEQDGDDGDYTSEIEQQKVQNEDVSGGDIIKTLVQNIKEEKIQKKNQNDNGINKILLTQSSQVNQ